MNRSHLDALAWADLVRGKLIAAAGIASQAIADAHYLGDELAISNLQRRIGDVLNAIADAQKMAMRAQMLAETPPEDGSQHLSSVGEVRTDGVGDDDRQRPNKTTPSGEQTCR